MKTRLLSAVSLLAVCTIAAWANPVDAQIPLPMDSQIHSGIKGEMPTSVFGGPGNARVAVFYNDSAGETWAWEPTSGADYSLRNGKNVCDGDRSVACSDDIEVMSGLSGSWTTVSAGLYPSINDYAVVWEDYSASPDGSIGWQHPSGYISNYLANNGRYEERPVLVGFDRVAYHVFNGSDYDVEMFDYPLGYVTLSMPDYGDEMHPDVVNGKFTWEGSGYSDGLGWMDWSGTDHDVPTSGTCAGYQRPRLGFHGDWVVYEGYGCPSGGSELFLTDMACGDVYIIDTLQPLIDVPSYAIVDDELIYANDHGEIVYIDVDESALCGGWPGRHVPTTFRAQSGQAARDVAVALTTDRLVVFSDSRDMWQWEPGLVPPFATGVADFTSVDGFEYLFTAQYGNDIFTYDAWGAWNHVGYGENPTVCVDLVAWEDPLFAPDGAISGVSSAGGAITSLAFNGLDEKKPALFKDILAYEVDVGGDWDIGVHDFPSDSPIAWVPSAGDERNPDIWYSFVAFDLNHSEIVRYDYDTGAYDVAPVPPDCHYLTQPLLGGDDRYGNIGDWVVFAALDCSGVDRGNELWLYSFVSGELYFVDRIGGLNDRAYHIVGNRLVYVDRNDTAVYLELDGSAI